MSTPQGYRVDAGDSPAPTIYIDTHSVYIYSSSAEENDMSAKAPHRRKQRIATAGRARKKVIIDFPSKLLQRTEAAAVHLATDRSKIIRSAVEQFLDGFERSALERQLIDGYRANADVDRRIAAEFTHVDAAERAAKL